MNKINKIICGNAIQELCKLENDSVDLIITSPPYFGQRRYITKFVDMDEIGQEESIFFYIQRLKIVFSECCRVCKSTGNIVFNLGDIYIDGCLQLIPYQFALEVIKAFNVKLINDITWVKTNPTPRQYNKRLINSTEPFFHFVKSDDYYYNRDDFLLDSKSIKSIKPNKSLKKGKSYEIKIRKSNLTAKEKLNAFISLAQVVSEVHNGEISDFRMKIKGMHKKAFGGQSGGRNNQIDKQGYTIIRMYGRKLKRDIIENSVANTKNIDHPAVFPLKVVTELVKLLSVENDMVLDPFCGSGQVCLAAKLLNRQYLGIDLNHDYCEKAEQRLKSRQTKI